MELGSDQTSCHNPFNGGYYPVQLTFEEAQRMMVEDPAKFKSAFLTFIIAICRTLYLSSSLRCVNSSPCRLHNILLPLFYMRTSISAPPDISAFHFGLGGLWKYPEGGNTRPHSYVFYPLPSTLSLSPPVSTHSHYAHYPPLTSCTLCPIL